MTRGGGGVKNRDFYGDILFEWPLRGINEIFQLTNFKKNALVCEVVDFDSD